MQKMDNFERDRSLKQGLTAWMSTSLACWVGEETARISMEHEIPYEEAIDVAIGALELNKSIFIANREKEGMA